MAPERNEPEPVGLITAHPRMVEHRTQVADLDARQQAWSARVAGERTVHGEALTRWHREVTEAAAAGLDPPPTTCHSGVGSALCKLLARLPEPPPPA